MKKALEIKNLRTVYDSGTEALKGIDLAVEEGDFYALLGPNGAGKSTTIGIITSLVNKTSGTVKVFDYDIDKNLVQAKQQLGLVPQEFNFNQFETSIKPDTMVFLVRKRSNAQKSISHSWNFGKSVMTVQDVFLVG